MPPTLIDYRQRHPWMRTGIWQDLVTETIHFMHVKYELLCGETEFKNGGYTALMGLTTCKECLKKISEMPDAFADGLAKWIEEKIKNA